MNQNEQVIKANSLYKEETFTDLESGAIKRFTPIADHAPDQVKYVAVATIMTPRGPIPVNAPIEGVTSLDEACGKFKEAVDSHIKEMVRRAEEYQKEQRTRIITPEEVVGQPKIQLVK